jgi:hypothetical protein
MRIHATAALASLLLGSAPLLGDPAGGFGVTLGAVTATQNGASSHGGSLGADAQFVLDGRWSFNPYLMVSLEHAPDYGGNLSDNLGGFQLRWWSGSLYAGPQVFFHDKLRYGGGKVLSSRYGPGAGLEAGWEGSSGWCAGVQLDALEDLFSNSFDQRTAVRFLVGYRWH